MVKASVYQGMSSHAPEHFLGLLGSLNGANEECYYLPVTLPGTLSGPWFTLFVHKDINFLVIIVAIHNYKIVYSSKYK